MSCSVTSFMPTIDARKLVAHPLVLGVHLLDDAGHFLARGMMRQHLFIRR